MLLWLLSIWSSSCTDTRTSCIASLEMYVSRTYMTVFESIMHLSQHVDEYDLTRNALGLVSDRIGRQLHEYCMFVADAALIKFAEDRVDGVPPVHRLKVRNGVLQTVSP